MLDTFWYILFDLVLLLMVWCLLSVICIIIRLATCGKSSVKSRSCRESGRPFLITNSLFYNKIHWSSIIFLTFWESGREFKLSGRKKFQSCDLHTCPTGTCFMTQTNVRMGITVYKWWSVAPLEETGFDAVFKTWLLIGRIQPPGFASLLSSSWSSWRPRRTDEGFTRS